MRKLFASCFVAMALLSSYGRADYFTAHESFEVASLIVNLARSITRDLSPPVQGAERIVTKALVSEDGNNRTYHIEGKDVYHTGRVLSTYWIRLSKPLTNTTGAMRASVEMTDHHSAAGRQVPEETVRLIGPLLNSLYDIAELALDHRNVLIEELWEPNSDEQTIHILGINNICVHEELNRFRLTLTRHTERNRIWYETVLEHPYGWGNVLPTPVTPPADLPFPTIPVPGDNG